MNGTFSKNIFSITMIIVLIFETYGKLALPQTSYYLSVLFYKKHEFWTVSKTVLFVVFYVLPLF